MISHAKYCFSTASAFDEYCKKYGARLDKIYRYPFTSVWEKDVLKKTLSDSDKKVLRTQLGIPEEHMLISVGRMIYRKGYDILLRAADLFVLSTRGDSWGMVVNEAMANALPVITTTRCIAGLEMVQDEENGFLYEAEDVGRLQEILSDIAEGKKDLSAMSRASLETAGKYTIERMVEAHCRYMDL